MGIGTLDWVDGGTGTWVPDLTSGEYYHGDMIGTTRLMTDAGGSTLAGSQSAHTAFGQPTSVSGNHRYGYAGAWGYQADASDGIAGPFAFLHVGARYYDPATGRFLQRDPIGISGGLNGYEYVSSRPTVAIDPSGAIPIEPGTTWPPDSTKSKEERRGERRAIRKGTGIVVWCIGNPWSKLRLTTKLLLWAFGFGSLVFD